MLSHGAYCLMKMWSLLLQAMKVVGIKAHTENDKGQVLLDLYIRWSFIYELLDLKTKSVSLLLRRCWQFFFCFFSYVGNVEINVEVKKYFCKAGVKGIQVCWAESGLRKASSPQSSQTCPALLCLQLHGMMRVILEPLIGDVPIVGAVTMFFIKRPVCPSVLISARPYIPSNITNPNIVIFGLRAIDFSCILIILHFSFFLPRNWTSIGLVWLICWIFLDLSESCWNYPLWGYQAHK